MEAFFYVLFPRNEVFSGEQENESIIGVRMASDPGDEFSIPPSHSWWILIIILC